MIIKIRYRILIIILAIVICLCSGCVEQQKIEIEMADVALQADLKYGVFIGVNPEDSDLFNKYDIVVVDAAYFAKEDIDKLHQKNTQVYSYLNIGSLEEFRDFFSEYKHLILDRYEDWPDEYWVDVSNDVWKSHIDKQAEALVLKGIDGFFIDNTDVYYQYQTPTIFTGLVDIVNGLNKYEKEILINGGDVFVRDAVIEANPSLIDIDGVNQECVFTSIDFKNERFAPQNDEDNRYYLEYLEQCSDKGLKVFLLEYSTSNEMLVEIDSYCKKQNFTYFISPSLNLDAVFNN